MAKFDHLLLPEQKTIEHMLFLGYIELGVKTLCRHTEMTWLVLPYG